MAPTEMTYTALARVAAGEGDGARAEGLVRIAAAAACPCHACDSRASIVDRGHASSRAVSQAAHLQPGVAVLLRRQRHPTGAPRMTMPAQQTLWRSET